MGAVRIGTSGWSYKHWKGPFYPEDLPNRQLLQFYFRSFSSVEINSSFYHLPLKRTFENWRDSSPDDFLFAVKASRYMTHNKKLKDSSDAVERFFERASGLGGKIGPILWQLPPSLKVDAERLKEFLELLPSEYGHTFEFRNQSWFDPEIYSLLRERRSAFCVYELGGRKSPVEITADFAYVRLHGPEGPYGGSYSREALSGWAGLFKGWAAEGVDVYCYFDNDEKGFAALNAVDLKAMVEDSGSFAVSRLRTTKKGCLPKDNRKFPVGSRHYKGHRNIRKLCPRDRFADCILVFHDVRFVPPTCLIQENRIRTRNRAPP